MCVCVFKRKRGGGGRERESVCVCVRVFEREKGLVGEMAQLQVCRPSARDRVQEIGFRRSRSGMRIDNFCHLLKHTTSEKPVPHEHDQ